MEISDILLLLLFHLTQVDMVGDKVDTEKIINSLMDESFPSLTLTDQFTYHKSGELIQQHHSIVGLFSYTRCMCIQFVLC